LKQIYKPAKRHIS